MSDLRNTVIRKGIFVNENPKKLNNIAEKILDFNNQREGTGLKILIPKQMISRLQISLVQVKAGNTSNNLLNEICQICDNIMNSIMS